jgi:hypothetical protein
VIGPRKVARDEWSLDFAIEVEQADVCILVQSIILAFNARDRLVCQPRGKEVEVSSCGWVAQGRAEDEHCIGTLLVDHLGRLKDGVPVSVLLKCFGGECLRLVDFGEAATCSWVRGRGDQEQALSGQAERQQGASAGGAHQRAGRISGRAHQRAQRGGGGRISAEAAGAEGRRWAHQRRGRLRVRGSARGRVEAAPAFCVRGEVVMCGTMERRREQAKSIVLSQVAPPAQGVDSCHMQVSFGAG